MRKNGPLFLLPIIAILLLFWFPVKGQDDPEVSIRERLGDTIPHGIMFHNEHGQPVEFRKVVHLPTILAFVYYDCPGICPMILSSVSDMIEKMDLELGKDFQVITVSFNDKDTPELSLVKKKEFLRKRSLPHQEDWTYLTGDSANIHELARMVGYNFKQAGNDFMHPACIIVLSPQGKITRYLDGTSYLPFDVKMAIVEAQKGLSRPTINRVLEYCFSFDPQGRKYTLEVTKISATIIIFFGLVLFLYLIIRSGRKNKKIV
ncbi:MAG: SCO family protein [Bacteroidota bacterium]